MLDKIEERRRKENNFLRLLYEKTAGEYKSEQDVSITRLCIDLGFYPGNENKDLLTKNKDLLTEEEKNQLFNAGEEAEDILKNLNRKGLIDTVIDCNPYYDNKVKITLKGMIQVEEASQRENREKLETPSTFNHYNSGGGSIIAGNVDTSGGNFMGRDTSIPTPVSGMGQKGIVALERRLQAHQEAYTLWRKLGTNVYDSNRIGNTVIECQEWWNNNCLYLSSDASTAFQSAYLAASHHGQFVEARESTQLIKENWADIERAGDIIMASAASIRAGKLETDNSPGDKVGQDKVSAIVGDSAANVVVGKDITQHITNNYATSSSLTEVALSDKEKELLVAAKENEDEIFMINTQRVNFVRVRRNYIKDGEPSSAALYREALEDLVERGYVRHENGIVYKLTSIGRRQARSLASKE